ncbi:MAG TPA: FtsX-like permease family protein [Acidimicrobiales bacterium]|nr:FtsX-like permease family protein [Acidimicrobiales bacterium]
MLKLSIRNLLSHKIRFFMTSFAVVLGVSFVVGSIVVTDTVRKSFDTLFDEITAGVDLEIRSVDPLSDEPGSLGPPLPAEVATQASAVDGVEIAEGQVGGIAQPIAPDGEPVTTTGAPKLAFSWGPTDELYPVTLELGAKPGPGEFAVDQGTFEDFDFVIGDTYDVLVPDGTESFVLSGTATFGSTNSLAGARLTMFDLDTAQRLFDREGVFDAIDIKLEPGADADAVQAAVAEGLPADAEVVTGAAVAQEGSDQIGELASIFGNILLGFAGVALFVSAFYIYNTFSIILGQRIRELALLRAIGATAAQIRATVILEALLVGIVSSIVGIGMGMLTALGLRGILNAGGFGLPADALVLKPPTVAVAFVIGVGVTLAASILPARKASSVPPVAALRADLATSESSRRLRLLIGAIIGGIGVALVGFGLFIADGTQPTLIGLGVGAIMVFLGIANLSPLVAGPVARLLGAPIAKVFKMPGRLAQENSARTPYRTASTASALVVGLALVTMVLVVGTSVKKTFAATIDQAVSADFIITDPNFAGVTPALADGLGADPAFEAVSGIRFDTFSFEGGTRDLVAVDAVSGGALVDIDIVDGGQIDDLTATSIFVHEDPARDLGLSPGDEVTVSFSATGDQTFTVAGIHADSLFAGNYLISTEAYEANFTDDLDPLIMAVVADGVDPETARASIDDALAEFPQLEVEDRSEFLASQEDQINQVLVSVNALLGLAIVIAVLGIANTLALSVFERTRELGLLRAVGMSKRQTRRMVRWEAAIVSLFGAVLGVAVGIAFGLAAASALPESFLSEIAIPVGTLLILVLVAMFAGLLAAIFPARRAGKLDILEAIASE